MPRKLKPVEVQRQRAKNYEHVYEMRRFFMALPVETQNRLVEISRSVPCPPLSLWGSEEVDSAIWVTLYKLGAAHGLDYHLSPYLHPWCHDEGWEIYKQMFQSLPEPVEFVHIPVDNWPVVHRQSVGMGG